MSSAIGAATAPGSTAGAPPPQSRSYRATDGASWAHPSSRRRRRLNGERGERATSCRRIPGIWHRGGRLAATSSMASDVSITRICLLNDFVPRLLRDSTCVGAHTRADRGCLAEHLPFSSLPRCASLGTAVGMGFRLHTDWRWKGSAVRKQGLHTRRRHRSNTDRHHSARQLFAQPAIQRADLLRAGKPRRT
jgi:hypothetical protein